jgi:hypothetical protein
MPATSQKHGKIYEQRYLQALGFDFTKSKPTDKHDAANNIKTISVKTSTNPKSICISDLLRVFEYRNDNRIHEMIIFIYDDLDNGIKRIKESYKIIIDDKFLKWLFGSCNRQSINNLRKKICDVPKGKVNKTVITEIMQMKKEMKCQHGMNVTMCHKIDSKTQRRLQGSFSLLKIPKEFNVKRWNGARIENITIDPDIMGSSTRRFCSAAEKTPYKICEGTTKNGKPCVWQAKKGVFCGRHTKPSKD